MLSTSKIIFVGLFLQQELRFTALNESIIMRPISVSRNTIKFIYSNDWHANANNIKRFATGVKAIRKADNRENPIVTVLTGDISMDINMDSGRFVQKAIRKIKANFISQGNHDMEGGDLWAKAYKKSKPLFSFIPKRKQPKFISANMTFSRENPIEKIISKSAIIKCKSKNGNVKVGVVGVSPFEYRKISFIGPHNDYMDVMDFENTLKAVKREAKKLRNKGAESITLSAHTGQKAPNGTNYYEAFADTDEFDVIFGGHDHKEVDYWYTTKSGKKVKIVSVGQTPTKNIIGQNLDSFGELKLVYNDNGRLIPEKCENKVHITADYPESKKIQRLENKYLKPHKVIGYTDKPIELNYTKRHEIPIANLGADSTIWLVNKETNGEPAQIAFVNAGTVRGSLPIGEITIGQIREAFPFTAPMLIKTTLTKAQIMETLNTGSLSTTYNKISPGVIQVNKELKYTIGKDNLVKEVYLLDNKGAVLERIDTQPNDKKYIVAYDNFLMTGPADLKALVKPPESPDVEYFQYSRQDAVIKYIKSEFKDKPVQVTTGRINQEF